MITPSPWRGPGGRFNANRLAMFCLLLLAVMRLVRAGAALVAVER